MIEPKSNGPDTEAQLRRLPSKVKVCENPTKDETRHAFERAIRYLERQPNGVAADEY
jgi:hypothetical protein